MVTVKMGQEVSGTAGVSSSGIETVDGEGSAWYTLTGRVETWTLVDIWSFVFRIGFSVIVGGFVRR